MPLSGGGGLDGYLEAYAFAIQHSVGTRRRRASLEWRFVDMHASGAVRVIQRLGALSGWHTISFQIDIAENLGDAIVRVAGETFLKRSDNCCVRIDEVYTRFGSPSTAPHRSTFVISGDALDVGKRHVHEDACSRQLSQSRWYTLHISDLSFRPGEWVTRTVRV